jgi:hypothetical protein
VYETADLPPAPSREGEAVGRAVCAAIINIAEHAALTRVSNMRSDVNVSVDISQALPASAQITLERLKSHYAERGYAERTERLFESRLAELDAYETSVIRQFVSETERFTPAERLLLTETERVDRRESETSVAEYRGVTRDFLEAQSEIRRERAGIERIVRQAAAPGGSEILRMFTERATGGAAHTRVEDDVSKRIDAIAGLIPSDADMSPGEMIYLREASALREEEAYGGPGSGAAAEGAANAGARDLKSELDAYDRRNKEAAQKLEERARALNAKTSKPGENERRRAAREALKALNEPEKIINALLEGKSESDASRTQPPGLTLLLAAASPEERTLYERVINYVQGAEASLDEGVRPISPLAFNADIAEIRERETVEMRHLEREYAEREEFVRERLDRAVDHERVVTPRKENSRAGDLRLRPPHMVHRQQEPAGLSDEDRDRIAAEIGGRTHSETTLHETILREQVSETEINRAVREAEAKSVDDISGMIDRALAVQMGTIAGRVYNQVERRLTMERARRGK